IPIISVFIGLLAGGVIMLMYGYNPSTGYAALWNGAVGDVYFFGETVRQVTPYILTGLAVAFALRAGLFNIGAERQVIVGSLAAVWIGSSFDLPMFIHLPSEILLAAAAGGILPCVQGLLKAKLGVHDEILTIMFNYLALFIANSIIRNVLTE